MLVMGRTKNGGAFRIAVGDVNGCAPQGWVIHATREFNLRVDALNGK